MMRRSVSIPAVFLLTALFALVGGCTRCEPGPSPKDEVSPSPAPSDSPSGAAPAQPSDTEPTTLAERLERLRADETAKTDPTHLSNYRLGMDEIAASGVLAKAPAVGEKAPDFSLSDQEGNRFHLAEALKDGPVVLLWYRGSWCSYCRHTLLAYQTYYNDFLHRGGRLVAIGPETPEQAQETARNLGLHYPVLSDPEHKAGRAYNIVYPLPGFFRESWESPFPPDERPDPIPGHLPLTALFVVGSDGTVRRAFLNADYRQRDEPAEVMEFLYRLKVERHKDTP